MKYTRFSAFRFIFRTHDMVRSDMYNVVSCQHIIQYLVKVRLITTFFRVILNKNIQVNYSLLKLTIVYSITIVFFPIEP